MKLHPTAEPRARGSARARLYQACCPRSVEDVRNFFRDLCTPRRAQAMADAG